MRRQKLNWLWATVGLTLLAAATAPAFPNVQEKTDTQAESRKTVEAILEQQEQLLRGARFTYDPGSRRDPFLSLYDVVKEGEGPRPPGVEGMGVDEIDLTGIVADSAGGSVAYFTGSDNKGYFLRVGQRVYKATMIAIDPARGSVTFRQQVDDPRQIKPYRDVVRTLVPVEENR
jgi:hypothetical protein